MAAGIVLALDLGARAAWALGPPGAAPYSGLIDLPFDAGDGAGAAALSDLLQGLWKRERPSVVAVEQRLVAHQKTNAAALQRLYGLHFIACEWAYRMRATLKETPVQKVRGWCLPNMAARDRSKKAVFDWAMERGLAPGATMYDQTDAVALWAYTVGWPQHGLDLPEAEANG